ncbi:MAG: dihydrofolate reductase family protein [Opitutales bacterium]
MEIILIAAISLDGFITKHDTPGSSFVSKEDRHYFRSVLPDFDCCILGAGSYRASRKWIREKMIPEALRVVLTRTPESFEEDEHPGSLEFTKKAPGDLVADLKHRGYRRCALLGGGRVYGEFLRSELVDLLWLTLEPRIFGEGTPLCRGRSDLSFELVSTEKLADHTLLLKYKPIPLSLA